MTHLPDNNGDGKGEKPDIIMANVYISVYVIAHSVYLFFTEDQV